jgi:hypothetical protein
MVEQMFELVNFPWQASRAGLTPPVSVDDQPKVKE